MNSNSHRAIGKLAIARGIVGAFSSATPTMFKRYVVSLLVALAVLATGRPAKAVQGAVCARTCPGGTPHVVTSQGNSSLPNAEVVPIFWGTWPNTQPSLGQVLGGVEAIVNGPYTAKLAQYGISPPRMSAMGDLYTAQLPPANNFQISTISNMINSEITNQKVPPPNAGADVSAALP